MKYICTIIILFLFILPGKAQVQIELPEGERNYQVIRDFVEDAYRTAAITGQRPANLPKYKHWARYSQWLSTHLDEEGNCLNVPAYQWKTRKQFSRNQGQRSAFADWEFVGPSSTTGTSKGLGRVDRIAFHPTDTNIIYIGTPAGGLWRTLNGGQTWVPLTDYLPSLGISGIVIDYNNPNTIFILTGTGDGNGFSTIYNYRQASIGVLKSTNGGQTWNPTGQFQGADSIFFGYKLAQSPTNPDFLIATTTSGVFRSLDHGDTWTNVRPGKSYDVAFKQTGDKVFITKASLSGCEFSDDNGETWNPITITGQAPSSEGRWEIETTPGEPCRFYLLCGPGDTTGIFNGLYQSLDCGDTFSFVSDEPNVFGSSDIPDSPGQNEYDIAMAVHPATGQGHKIVIGGLVIFRSLDYGQNINEMTDYFEQSGDPESYIHPDVHDLAFNPLSNTLYAATDGGLYKSYDIGDTWIDLSDGIETSMIYNMAGTLLNDEMLLIGTQDNGIQFRDGNTSTFDFLATGDGFSVQFSPTSTGFGYCTINNSVLRLSNSLQTLSSITPEDDINIDDHFFPRILVHNSDPSRIICSYYVTLYSNNSGTTWTVPDLEDNGRGYHALVACPSNDNRVYCAGSVNFNDNTSITYRSDNFGETWTPLSINSGYPSGSPRVTGIAVYPGLSSNVWISFGNYDPGQKVYFSSDAGSNWQNLTGDLPNTVVNCIAVDANNQVYIGTDGGVFFRTLFSDGWTLFSNGLPNVPITSLVIDQDAGIIRAASYGRGIWESELYTSCDQDIVITTNQTGEYFFQADNSIIFSGKQRGGMFTSGFLKSAGYIELLPGFETFQNQLFSANIDECGAGGLPD